MHHFSSRASRPLPVRAASPIVERWLRLIPLALSIFVASSVVWAPWDRRTAAVLGIGLTAFFVYWVVRSYAVAAAVLVARHRVRDGEATDWRATYEAGTHPRPWDWPRHLVIIPNYREPEALLLRTLRGLAEQSNAEQLVVVLAMEEREPDVRAKAARLVASFPTAFARVFATFHPAGLPGEVPGKGSNEAWAAREAFTRLITIDGDDIDRYTVTSCDADAVFSPAYFAALNYQFLTDADPYRAFWQPVILNSNNIWDVPALLRVMEGLSGVNRAANLVLPFSVKFPTSCYSLSWRMLEEVDYWDEEVVPEDWHVFLKCALALGNRVRVRPLWVRVGNDCVEAGNTVATLKAHYVQAKRHAWGASDIPYAWRGLIDGRASVARRALLAAALTKVHVFWVAQWYLVTLGVVVPSRLASALGAPMPDWWTHRTVTMPGVTWHLERLGAPELWLGRGVEHGLVSLGMSMNLCGLLLALCLLPLVVIIVVETRSRPPRPPHISNARWAAQFTVWPLMAPITFAWASLPALDAQMQIAFGPDLQYRVAQKGLSLRPVAAAIDPSEAETLLVVVARD